MREESFILRPSLVAVVFWAERSNFRSYLEVYKLACILVIKCCIIFGRFIL